MHTGLRKWPSSRGNKGWRAGIESGRAGDGSPLTKDVGVMQETMTGAYALLDGQELLELALTWNY